jgi:phenylalanyl-tRNA synthetase beta chain
MKLSLNWLKEYIQTNQPEEIITEVLTNIGLEVESVEKIERIKGGLKGLVVAEILECEKHPDAEKLSLTTVDIGSAENLSIVCGAPNVAKGQKVIVATVGATLYPITGEPLTMKKTKIRGAASEGMICAEDEIGLGNSHAGIMVLDKDAPVGMSAADYFNSIGGYNGIKIESDTLIEIGLTPNRSDATGHLGVAFDIAAALKINYPGQLIFINPIAPEFPNNLPESPVKVEIKNPEKCSRYSGICIKDVKIAPSPDWLVSRLQTIGLSPINNIVDITNFVLHELGQPLHAFDLHKISGEKIIVQTLPEGTKFITLDEVERTLKGSELMICDGFSNPMCIAGVFGGKDSGISEQTVDIFLESAHFNPKSIRTTSMSMQLRTDAASCFEKGTDPNITIFALQRAAYLIQQIAGGKVISAPVDLYPNPVARKEVTLRFYNIRRLIGKDLSEEKILDILVALDMTILSKNELEINVAVPTNKSDVLREIDVIEEILRIYGYNNVESSEMLSASLSFSNKPDSYKVKSKVSEWLVAMGFS